MPPGPDGCPGPVTASICPFVRPESSRRVRVSVGAPTASSAGAAEAFHVDSSLASHKMGPGRRGRGRHGRRHFVRRRGGRCVMVAVTPSRESPRLRKGPCASAAAGESAQPGRTDGRTAAAPTPSSAAPEGPGPARPAASPLPGQGLRPSRASHTLTGRRVSGIS